jgi:pimeloyl-ACP methyl ester carboxylesterase
MRARQLVAVIGTGTMVLAATIPGATATEPDQAQRLPVPSQYLEQKLSWQQCGDPEMRTECALVRVPRDWDKAYAGDDIQVAISKAEPKTRPKTKPRVVFGNPGGPGAPGLGMAPYLASLPGLSGHVAVGFDPRGTGDSTNVTCDGAPLYTMDPRDRDRKNLNLTADASKLTGRYCQDRSNGLLPKITTEQTVQDMDLVRRLLGYETIDYVGYSGGTWLGAYYQKYFPEHVGRFVLDSNTDFTAPWSKTFEAQPQGFERRFREDYATWAAKYDGMLKLGSTPGQVRRYYEKLRKDLKQQPIVIDVFGFDLLIDQNLLDGLITGSMYSKLDFQDLSGTMTEFREMWNEQRTGGAQAAQARFDRQPATQRRAFADRVQLTRRNRLGLPLAPPLAADAADATFYAITCNDTPWPRGQAYGDVLSSRLGPRYPLIGWSMNQNPCAYWERPDLAMPVPDGEGLPTTLMVQSVHDPATNASLAYDAHERYHGSRLITVTNEGDHGVYGGVNACTDTLVDAFLKTGAASKTDVTCVGEGIPAPVKDEPERPAEQERDASISPLNRVADLGTRLRGFAQ